MQIDLRSDTVTRPSKGMLDAMMTAKLGDDVYAEDPSVNSLEARSCNAMFGKPKALVFSFWNHGQPNCYQAPYTAR